MTLAPVRRLRLACLAALLAGLTAAIPAAGSAATHHHRPAVAEPLHAVRAGHARFEVLSPTLIRLEYAPDRHFEDRPTVVAQDRTPIAAFSASRSHGVLTIRTAALVLRYRIARGRFTPADVSVRPLNGTWSAHPGWSTAAAEGSVHKPNLGGWIRALDDRAGPVPIHPGLLTRAGWYLINDSTDPILTARPSYLIRHTASGYQDGYFFGYGDHYAQALHDLRTLTGPAPLLPRTAFGVWFSRYYAYSAAQYPQLLRQFRKNKVPLDTISIDTDWKRQPSPISPVLASTVVGHTPAWSWNGWEWNSTLFPQPRKFIAWAHHHGIAIALNIHPSIDSTDPKYNATVAKTGPLKLDPMCTLQQIDPLGQCHVFDLSQQRQVAAYFALQDPIQADGVDEWWLDWCCDATSASAPGLTPDTWLNLLYTAHLHAGGNRWLVLSRVGGSHQGDDPVAGPGPGIFAEHRYAIHFTADTCATWAMVGFEAKLSAEEGNVGLPYVSHDIGSFNGAPIHKQCSASAGASGSKLPADMYARWVQLGAFQPILRLHSNHGARLPWEYPRAADRAAADALRLRESLVPYLYTVAREAYDTGLPMVRSLYLQWPRLKAAYRYPAEFTLGRDVLVRPVTAKGNPARATIWFPPGNWVDPHSRAVVVGPETVNFTVPLDWIPYFVREGAVLATQPPVDHISVRPQDHLILTVYGNHDGTTRLYDDAGQGFGYQRGQYSWTTIRHVATPHGQSVIIEPARGRFPGALRHRSWTIRFVGASERGRGVVTVRTGEVSTAKPVVVRLP